MIKAKLVDHGKSKGSSTVYLSKPFERFGLSLGLNTGVVSIAIYSMLIVILLHVSAVWASSRVITYSWPKSMSADKRGNYPVALLKLALEKSGSGITAVPSEFVMTQYRTLKQLELGHGIDVVWTMTNSAREQQLKAIRFPLDRGLIGYRLLAINGDDASAFAGLAEPEQLKQYLTVQGIDWPDYEILQANGFRVTASNYFAGMYPMLVKKRVQFFARSVTEIWPELAKQANHGIVVSPRWVLHYPAALYFFVRHGDTELADVIARGLDLALQDGSFKALFLEHFADVIQQADLAGRQVFELRNPTLPPLTPLDRAELWFNLKEGF